MLARDKRLRRGADITRTIRRGTRSGRTHLVVHGIDSHDASGPLVGFVVSKAIGNAVMRNLVKRRLREAVADRYAKMRPGWYVVRALPGAAEADFATLAEELGSALSTVERRLEHGASKSSAPKRGSR